MRQLYGIAKINSRCSTKMGIKIPVEQYTVPQVWFILLPYGPALSTSFEVHCLLSLYCRSDAAQRDTNILSYSTFGVKWLKFKINFCLYDYNIDSSTIYKMKRGWLSQPVFAIQSHNGSICPFSITKRHRFCRCQIAPICHAFFLKLPNPPWLSSKMRYNYPCRAQKVQCRSKCSQHLPPAYGELGSIRNRIIGTLRFLLYRLFCFLYRGFRNKFCAVLRNAGYGRCPYPAFFCALHHRESVGFLTWIPLKRPCRFLLFCLWKDVFINEGSAIRLGLKKYFILFVFSSAGWRCLPKFPQENSFIQPAVLPNRRLWELR